MAHFGQMNKALHIIGVFALPLCAVFQCLIAPLIYDAYGAAVTLLYGVTFMFTLVGFAARLDYQKTQPPEDTD